MGARGQEYMGQALDRNLRGRTWGPLGRVGAGGMQSIWMISVGCFCECRVGLSHHGCAARPWGWNQEVCGPSRYLWRPGSSQGGDLRWALGLSGHWPKHFDLRIQTLESDFNFFVPQFLCR